MKKIKNAQYIGVEDEFVPEDEKYVDESLLGNKEETRKKVGKAAKVMGIGYFANTIIFLVVFIAIFVFAFMFMGGLFKEMKNQSSSFNSDFDATIDEAEKNTFNMKFEMYEGTESGSGVRNIFDQVVTNNKKNSDKIIRVIYNENDTTNPNDIIELKKLLDNSKKYEVILDYDLNGYVNQVTIQDI